MCFVCFVVWGGGGVALLLLPHTCVNKQKGGVNKGGAHAVHVQQAIHRSYTGRTQAIHCGGSCHTRSLNRECAMSGMPERPPKKAPFASSSR